MSKELNDDQRGLLVAVLYADVFDFAATAVELRRYVPLVPIELDGALDALDALVAAGHVGLDGEYYTLSGREELARIRRERQERAQAMWERVAVEMPGLLSLPQIRGAFVTGSLAANNPIEGADVDVMLVAERGRTFATLYAMRLLRRRYPELRFCPNYVISEDELDLLYPNLLTAYEWSLAVPVKWSDAASQVELSNPWLRRWVPNADPGEHRLKAMTNGRVSRVGRLLDTPLGGLFDRICYEWVRVRSKGRYAPKRGTFKPHSPARHRRILAELLKRMDERGIAWPRLEAELARELDQLAVALRDWEAASR